MTALATFGIISRKLCAFRSNLKDISKYLRNYDVKKGKTICCPRENTDLIFLNILVRLSL
jgi:hypothetical protein